MIQEIIVPKDRKHWLSLRTQDVTSTETAALFGSSPYSTYFELAHNKRNQTVVEIEANERMAWGSRLEKAIAEGVAEDNSWEIRKASEYIRLPEIKLGASFDYFVDDEGVLEVKNVDALMFKEGWLIDESGNLEAPPHIEFQVQTQLLVSKKKYAYIAALVGGNRIVLIKREPDTLVFEAIKKSVAEFWNKVKSGEPITPDFRVDADFICKIHGFAEPGKVLDATQSADLSGLAAQYKVLGSAIKEMEEKRLAVKAQMLMTIGDAEKVLGDGFSISAGVVGPAHIEFDREPYRNFRINWKKK